MLINLLGRVLALHENIIGIYNLFDPAGNNAKAGKYNIKVVVFTFNNQAELETILQRLCKLYDEVTPKDGTIPRKAIHSWRTTSP